MTRLMSSKFLIIVRISAFIFIVSYNIKRINGENFNGKNHNVNNTDLGEISIDDLHTYYDVFNLTRSNIDSDIDDFAFFEDNNQKEEPVLYKSRYVNRSWNEKINRVFREFSSTMIQIGEFLTAKLIPVEDYRCKIVEDYFMAGNGEGVLRIGVKSRGAKKCSSTVEVNKVLVAISKFLGKHSNTCKTWCLKLTHDGNWVGYVKDGIDDNAWKGVGCNVHQKFKGC